MTQNSGRETDVGQIYRATEATKQLDDLARQAGRSLSDALSKAAISGERFEKVMKTISKQLAEIALKSALKPLELAFSQATFDFSKSLLDPILKTMPGQVTASANGNVFSRGLTIPFADGGVIGAPTYFPLGRGLGLMGEKGAEAIMPLSRGEDGKLGVRMSGPQRPMQITVNVSTPDADSFRRSEAQVTAALARAVARGRRGL